MIPQIIESKNSFLIFFIVQFEVTYLKATSVIEDKRIVAGINAAALKAFTIVFSPKTKR